MEIMRVKGLMRILESWKNRSEFWKSPGNLFLKKGTNPDHNYVNPLNKVYFIGADMLFSHAIFLVFSA